MRIDDTRGPNFGGPEGPGGSTPTGSIGKWSGRIGQPGNPRLPGEPFSGGPSREPLQNRPPLHASLVESATLDTATIQELESVHDWLRSSDAHVSHYVDGILMTSMLRDVLGRT